MSMMPEWRKEEPGLHKVTEQKTAINFWVIVFHQRSEAGEHSHSFLELSGKQIPSAHKITILTGKMIAGS
jgi:hypothetical protein